MFLPTRLIDVGIADEWKLALVLGTEILKNRRYLALSHCWGLAMPESAKTTSSNLHQHMASVSIADLPKTFQEFIGIAQRLGLRYVWIDSLCIIQDSWDDWEKEAAQMGMVYSNAHLTIAASGSADGKEGCHIEDEVRSYGPVDIEYPDEDKAADSMSSTSMFRMWSRDTYPVGQILSSDPLTSRGWTLQERELSPRVLHYSRDSMRWECYELRASIEFPWGDAASFDVGRLFDGGSSTRPTQIGPPINDSKLLDDITKQRLSWFEIVSRYTARSLTKQSDVLPALSGIARAFAKSTSDEYCAGLWKSYIEHCLLWASNWHVSSGFKLHSRPSGSYLAPSWSWASVKGPTGYLSWINGYYHTFNTDLDPIYTAKLVEISLESLSDPPYGALKAGLLKLEGKVCMGFSKQEVYAVAKNQFNVTFTQGPQDRLDLYGVSSGGAFGKIGQIRYDIPLCYDCSPVGSMRAVWLLCCMNRKSSDGRITTFALALEGEEEEEDLRPLVPKRIPTKFRRVGVAWGIESSFWEISVLSTLSIV
jgi:hypothetical protein